ncbi:hypothetical protein JCM5350_000819 [Sporobolomyces pararoseus]
MPPLRYSRPSQNRRPPFYPLVNPKELEQISVLDSEIGNEPLLEHFDDGSLESVKRWYSELQAVSDWLYQAGSPSLVDPTQPNQHARHLFQFAFETRAEGAAVVSWNAKVLYDKLCSPTFAEEYVKPWKALSSQSREELLLEAFAASDRRGFPKAFVFSRNHKLVPEFDVIDLTAEDGKGLLDLLNHLRVNLVNCDQLSTKPIPNEKFFGKFGIGIGQEELPLSRADRAFQEEYLLKRHSLILSVVDEILGRIVGEPRVTSPILIGDLPSDAKERCAGCFLTLDEAGLKRFMYCGRCKKIDRDVPYCSALCQKKDWSEHKKKCSTENSHRQVPIVSTSHSSLSTDIPLLRRLMITALDKHSTEYWLYEVDGEPGKFQVQGFKSHDRSEESRIRTAMRSLAFKALETGDRTSIALLAVTLYSSDPWLPHYISKGNKVKPATSQPEEVMSDRSRIKHFRRVFDITSDSEWSEIMKLGKVEIEKPENEVIRKLRDHMAEQEHEQRTRLLDHLTPHRPEDPESIQQLLRLVTEMMLGFDDERATATRSVGDVLRLAYGQHSS